MLRYFKMRDDLLAPAPAKDLYLKRTATKDTGRGWPEECPPIRAANSFGFDLLANFDVTFTRAGDGTWSADADIELSSDFDYSPDPETGGVPLVQRYAWFWDRGQTVPHVISDDVFEVIKNQVKLSTFLFLQTDPNEVLLLQDPPAASTEPRGWRAMPALIETDWYTPANPWHVVLELDPDREQVSLTKGEPICRAIPVRRDTYFAQQMSVGEFDTMFERSQKWLTTHGRPSAQEGVLDITRTYVKQQARSKFVVLD